MHVDAAGRHNLALARDHFGPRSDDDVDVRPHIGIASFAYGGNTTVRDADVGLPDSPVIENQRVGDDRINGALAAGALRLAHAIADDFPSSELHLLTVGCEVLFHLDDQVGIREAYLVADRWAKHLRIGGATHYVGHFRLPRLFKRTGHGAGNRRQRSHHRLVEAINQARTLIRDQRNFARLARLETHSRSRGNVQAIPKSSLPIKRQSRVGLSEMIMTANLDRPVTRVGDRQRDGNSILVQGDLARCWKDFARYHNGSLANWIVDRD